MKLIDITDPIKFHIAEDYFVSQNYDSALYYLNSINPPNRELFHSLRLWHRVKSLKFDIFLKMNDYKNAATAANEIFILNNKINEIDPRLKLLDNLKTLEAEKNKHIIENERRQKESVIIIVSIIIIGIIIILFVVYNRYKKIQLLNTKLDEANNTKNKLFRIISHDLNNPVNSSLMLCEQMVSYIDKMDKQDIKTNADFILQSSKNLKSLVDSLIQWSRVNLDGFKKKNDKTNLYELLKSILSDIQTNLNLKNISLIIEIPMDYEVEFDSNALRVVIRNLLTNAIKFSQINSKVIVKLDENNLHIIDSGIGFTDEQIKGTINANQSRLGTNNEAGIGIGLQIVKDICDKYDTKVRISNNQNGGGGTVSLEFL